MRHKAGHSSIHTYTNESSIQKNFPIRRIEFGDLPILKPCRYTNECICIKRERDMHSYVEIFSSDATNPRSSPIQQYFFSNALELASVNEENSPKWLIEVEKQNSAALQKFYFLSMTTK